MTQGPAKLVIVQERREIRFETGSMGARRKIAFV